MVNAVKKIGLFYPLHLIDDESVQSLLTYLYREGFDVFPALAFSDANVPEDIDLAISVGGDGTVLHAANAIVNCEKTVPLVRVNAGHVGYLTNVKISEIPGRVKDIAEENYFLVERRRVEATVKRGRRKFRCHALNEIVLERINESALYLAVTIESKDQEGLNKDEQITVRGDGILYATHTGSSAYNRSLFAPVLPSEDNFILTVKGPTDPEDGYYFKRPFDAIVTVDNFENNSVKLVVDGRKFLVLKPNDVVKMTRSEKSTWFAEFGKNPA